MGLDVVIGTACNAPENPLQFGRVNHIHGRVVATAVVAQSDGAIVGRLYIHLDDGIVDGIALIRVGSLAHIVVVLQALKEHVGVDTVAGRVVHTHDEFECVVRTRILATTYRHVVVSQRQRHLDILIVDKVACGHAKIIGRCPHGVVTGSHSVVGSGKLGSRQLSGCPLTMCLCKCGCRNHSSRHNSK